MLDSYLGMMSVMDVVALVLPSEGTKQGCEKILLVRPRGKNTYYLPGGKVEAGEMLITALIREIREELSVTLEASKLQPLTLIEAPAYGEAPGTQVRLHCYEYAQPWAKELHQKIHPAAEITALEYFDAEEYAALPERAPAQEELFRWLSLRRQ